jgi:hypothetical protein
VDDGRQEITRNSQRFNSRGPATTAYLSLAQQRESIRIKTMEYVEQNEVMYQSNSRAEDGPAPAPKLEIYEGVVIPLAALGAALLFVAGAMVLTIH